MPISWKKTTETEHARIPINPETGKRVDIFSGQDRGKIKVGFISSTKGVHQIPGSEAPAAARVQRFKELSDEKHIVKSVDGDILVPCLAHGDYVKVECTQLDHMQPKANILKRQDDLIKKLNEDKKFASFLMKKPGMNKFFIKCGEHYYGTLLFYEVYFNDIDNLWLICSACNLQKGDQDTLNWLENQWLYGKKFLDYLAEKGKSTDVESEGILEKTKDQEGLAEVAITWFWERHANYVSTSKSLYENVITPMQILNKRVDHIIGSGNLARADRRLVDLEARMSLAGAMVGAKIGMPLQEGEFEESSSDEDLRLSQVTDGSGRIISVNPEGYLEAVQAIAQEFKREAPERIKSKLRKLSADTKKRA